MKTKNTPFPQKSKKKNFEKTKPKHLQKPDPIDPKAFQKYCTKIGIKLNTEEEKSLLHYLDALMLWNTRINLVGTLEWRETLSELIIDSVYLADFIKSIESLNKTEIRTWDLGSGAGLPGIPLRMLWHEGEYTLVEAREKRALFMTNFLLKEPLVGTKVFWGRAEKLFAKEAEEGRQADLIVSRAFMPYEELSEFIFPYLKKDGILLLMLNENLESISNSFKEQWKCEKSHAYTIESLNNQDNQGKQAKQERFFHAFTKK